MQMRHGLIYSFLGNRGDRNSPFTRELPRLFRIQLEFQYIYLWVVKNPVNEKKWKCPFFDFVNL